MTIDHVVLAVPDLDDAVRTLAKRGVVCAPGGRHPAHGTHNALARIGARTYLEVLAADPGASAAERSPRGAAIASVPHPIVHEIVLGEPDAARMDAARSIYDVDEPRSGHRLGDDGREVVWTLTSWRTRGGARLPDLIRWENEHPVDTLPASDVAVHVRWSHPHSEEVFAALEAVGAGEVGGERGDEALRVELITPASGSVLLAVDGPTA